MVRALAWGMLALLVGLTGIAPRQALADTESCAQFRQAIVDMEAKSVRPVGWLGLDLYLRSLYAEQCVLHPTRKARTEYWYRADGTPLGLQAGYTPPGWDPSKPYRPEEGAYTTTPEIAAACAQVPQLTPGMCALMKGVEASCRAPVDTQERTQCAAILEGQVPTLPPASEPLPPVAALLGPLQPGAPQSSNTAIAADPGFQRMCGQARDNYNTCTVRRQNMTSLGTTNQSGSGQAGAFYECQQLYDGVLRMCGAVTSQRMPRMALVAPTRSVPPPSAQKPGEGSGRSTPPPAASKPASGSRGGNYLGPGWVADPKTGCHAYAEGAPPEVSMSWTGPCVNGRAHGRGQLLWFLSGELRDTYDGEYQDGKMNGRGILTSVDGRRYEGQYRDDKQDGRGIDTWPDGRRYEGEYKAGVPDGMGSYWAPVEGGPRPGEWHAYRGQWHRGCFASPPYFAALGGAIPEECEALSGTR